MITQTANTPDMRFPIGAMTGTVEWIGLRPERLGDIRSVTDARAEVGSGLVDDHFAGRSSDKRAVTLIQAEHLAVVGDLLQRNTVDPASARRNIVVRGLNLLALKGRKFTIGSAIFEGTGPCPPCGRMEENLGTGGYQAMRGHGGITARVVTAGSFAVGDTITVQEV